MEVVSDPDIRSAYEASEYVKKLRSILRYLGTCDGDMDKGSMRCDVNISMRRVGATEYGTRAEIKNVNSIKNIVKAVAFEAQRQVDLLEDGGEVVQETRLYDAGKNETRSMRSKEEAHDYRYFPDPDLLPLDITDEFIENIKKDLPELPDDKKEKYMNEFGLSAYDASVLVSEQSIAEFFEKAVQNSNPKLVANWLTVELFGLLNKNDLSIENSPVSAVNLGNLVKFIKDGTISGKIAKTVFEEMFNTGQEPGKIIEEKGLKQVSDTGAIEKMIDTILEQNADKVAEYKSGKDKLFGFFVGQAMKLSQGKANPQTLNEILKKKLSA
ncbi:UNVERIFIED_CONTAM: hypothetical protein GTU68_014040 [Idotea baltica]|nr:hypothetical protein [Idotea baltica]